MADVQVSPNPLWYVKARAHLLIAGNHFRTGSDLHLLEMAVRDYDELTKKLELVRERVIAIRRETQRPGDLALNMGTIETMCEAILNSDFAEEIGVEATL